MNLEADLRRRVTGQEEAVSAVARAIRRGRTGLKEPDRPVGAFSSWAPRGWGKTELCKALAQVLFGSEEALLRFDMTEFAEKAHHEPPHRLGRPPPLPHGPWTRTTPFSPRMGTALPPWAPPCALPTMRPSL